MPAAVGKTSSGDLRESVWDSKVMARTESSTPENNSGRPIDPGSWVERWK